MKGKTKEDKKDELVAKTATERNLLKRLRDLAEMKLEGNAKEFWVRMDEARMNVETAKYLIKIKLQKIEEINLEIKINQEQLKGTIWRHREGYPEVKFTKEELECEINKLKLGIENEVSGIRNSLVQIIPFIGVLSLDRNQVITREQFDNYFLWVRLRVKDLTNKEL